MQTSPTVGAIFVRDNIFWAEFGMMLQLQGWINSPLRQTWLQLADG
jgi:antibiotic biosynthesis monooxygenase (ABM) superfamily enzyme